MNTEKEKVVLLSVVGMSPAILTETIWSLHQEKPEMVPDEVKIYTTQKAWDNLQQKLLSRDSGLSVWEDLQKKLDKKISLNKHIFHNANGEDLPDIITSEDQELVADQLLKGIREYKNPQQEVCRLVASIAGGRKSMSALMYAAMTLGAAANDIITHVLVDDNASLCRDFFFPKQEQQKLVVTINGKEKSIKANKVRLDMAEIPFVPLSSLVSNEDFDKSGAFSKLIERARTAVAKMDPKNTSIRVCQTRCEAYINDQKIQLKENPHTLLMLMAAHTIRAQQDKEGIYSMDATRAFVMLQTLKANKRLPAAILKYAEKQKSMNRRSFIDNEEWKGINESDKCFPDGTDKIKHNLKQELKKISEFVAKDAFSNTWLGFNQIQNVSFYK